MIKTTVLGFYPKISEDPRVPNYRRARNRLDRGDIDQGQFDAVVRSTIERVVHEQVDVGIDLPTDGQVEWDDLVTPFARAWQGLRPGGLIRFFDNNVYYRRAQIEADIVARTPATTNGYKLARGATDVPLKALLPGPLTFMRMADDHNYRDATKLQADLWRALNFEARALQEAGCTHLQIDEPFLCLAPDQIDLCAQGLRTMLDGVTLQTTLALYFQSLKPLLPALWRLPVDGFALDCVSSPENLELALSAPADFAVVFGISDARNTGREAPAYLKDVLEQIGSRRIGCENWVAPNAQLEFLPHADLQQKLRDLTTAVTAYNRQKAEG